MEQIFVPSTFLFLQIYQKKKFLFILWYLFPLYKNPFNLPFHHLYNPFLNVLFHSLLKKSQFSINSIKAKKPDTSTQQRTYWIKVTRASSSTIDPSKATRERLITTLFILRMPSLCLGAALRPPSSAMDGILRLIDESVCPSIRGSVRVERWKLIKRPSGRPATTRPGYSSLFVIKTVLTSIEKSDFCLAENRYGV